MTSVENLIAVYNGTPLDNMVKSIIKNILKNLEKIEKMTIYELSDLCYTSPASISRLVKKLGYKNYSYFQKDVVDCLQQYEYHNRLLPMENLPEDKNFSEIFIGSLKSMLTNVEEKLDMEKVKELAEKLHNSQSISIFSYGGGMAETFLQSDLFMSGKICDLFYINKDILERSKTLDENDFVLLVAPKAIEGMDADKIIDTLHEKGARVCVVTDTKHFSILKKADYSFVMEGMLRGIDMFVLQTFICILTMEYRKTYID